MVDVELALPTEKQALLAPLRDPHLHLSAVQETDLQGDLAAEVDHFLSCIASDAPFTQSIEEAMGAVAVNDAILRSVVSGNPEAVEII